MDSNNPYAPPTAPVRDIPAEGSALELADRGTRLGATLIDGLIGGILCGLPLVFVAKLGDLVGTNGTPNYKALLGAVGLAMLPGAIIYAGVTTWLVIRNGQTMGKKLLAIKVVRTNGDRAGLGRLFWLRNVILNVVAQIPFVGALVSLLDALLIFRESRKCLHDQIADTIVIKA